jgi:pimeloyl-ACP methyl ester carboxylesterase
MERRQSAFARPNSFSESCALKRLAVPNPRERLGSGAGAAEPKRLRRSAGGSLPSAALISTPAWHLSETAFEQGTLTRRHGCDEAEAVRGHNGLMLDPVIRPFLNAFLYFPTHELAAEPADFDLDATQLDIEAEDGERLDGWWISASAPSTGHVLFCHGNGGNIGDRLDNARLLAEAGFDLLLFDYRGYGRSSGRPSEEGTYRDAHAARRVLLEQAGVEASRVLYLGESLGGAIALNLALEVPPRGLVLQSAFTSVRDVAVAHYPFLPRFPVPDAYPSHQRVGRLRSPLLVLHGEADEVVPVSHARALYQAAPEPKRLELLPGVGHNDLVFGASTAYVEAVASWAEELEADDRLAER